MFVDISVVIVVCVVFGWREQCKADKLFWTLTVRSLWGLQHGEVLEAFISKGLEPRRHHEAKGKTQGPRQKSGETFSGWGEAKELTEDVKGSGRERMQRI